MPRSGDERGFLTAGFVVAVALSLVLLATLGNLLVQGYARAAVQAALDEGVRAGTLAVADGADCAGRARAALRTMLRGPYGRSVRITCVRGSRTVTARGRGRLEGWAPLVPDLRLDLSASATAEQR